MHTPNDKTLYFVLAFLITQQFLATLFKVNFFPITDNRIFSDHRVIDEPVYFRLAIKTGPKEYEFIHDSHKFTLHYEIQRIFLRNTTDAFLETELTDAIRKYSIIKNQPLALFKTTLTRNENSVLSLNNELLFEL